MESTNKKGKTGNKADMPGWVSAMFFIDAFQIDKNECFYIRPKENFSEEYFFYIYDNRNGHRPSNRELKFVLDICKRTGKGAFIPLYPLVHEHTEDEVQEFMREAYKSFCLSFGEGKLIMISSGSGVKVALKLMQGAWKEGLRFSDKIIMIAPVIDDEMLLNEDYDDFVDFCRDITICHGSEDEERELVRYFINTLTEEGLEIKYFEYKDAPCDFYLSPGRRDTKHMKRILMDIILDVTKNAISEHMYEIKRRGDITKRYPEIFTDERAVMFISKNKIFTKRKRHFGRYQDLLLAASYKKFDDAARLFLKEYPNGTVVYLGCNLDTMYDRVDNGRVTWYNLDRAGRMAIRKMYTVAGEREINIEKTVDDLSWFDDIKTDTGFGLLILCRNIFVYYSAKEVKEYINKIYEKFPGAQVVFDASNQITMFNKDFYEPDKELKIRTRKYFINSPERAVSAWNPAFTIVWSKSMLEGIKAPEDSRLSLRLRLWWENISKRYMIIKIKLGVEKYKQYHNIYKER